MLIVATVASGQADSPASLPPVGRSPCQLRRFINVLTLVPAGPPGQDRPAPRGGGPGSGLSLDIRGPEPDPEPPAPGPPSEA